MDKVLHQIGELLLGSVPTILLFLLTWAMYNFIVHRKLMAVLDERRAKTEGAVEKARRDIAAVEKKAAEYDERIRQARQAVLKAAEERRRQIMDARAKTLAEAKATAETQVKTARAALEKEVAAARTGLQAEAEALSAVIVRSVLRPAGTAVPAGGAQ
ncbi:MAG: ATP synthase F0 subunit B [Terriglobales bacterium]